jgi:asparagine synthase (glutamine-hydrolysing)
MELAKKNDVTVLLDGQGADEYLAGYLPYYQTYLNQLYYSNLNLFDTEVFAYNSLHRSLSSYADISKTETKRMKLGKLRRKIFGQDMPYKNALQKELIKHSTQSGLKELLRYADRNSMAHSREVRLPFLSHKLVEFVFSLPDEFKLNSGWTKFVLRKSMDKILPPSICWRVDKIGYEPPQQLWIESDRFNQEIQQASKTFDITRVDESLNNSIFNQDWRLLMASKFI